MGAGERVSSFHDALKAPVAAEHIDERCSRRTLGRFNLYACRERNVGWCITATCAEIVTMIMNISNVHTGR